MSEIAMISGKPRLARVDPASITVDPAFVVRQGSWDPGHVRSLASVVRGGSHLDPVLLWQDPTGKANGFTLLDGAYRLAAYGAGGWHGPIPARIVKCGRKEALLHAAGANAKDRKGLTPAEKQDFAWRLVRDEALAFSKSELARATGVSGSTIARMRARWRELRQREDAQPTGRWWQDRDDRDREDRTITEMTSAQRLRAANEVAGQLRDVLDWRKGNPALRDSEIRFDAIAQALGQQQLRALLDYHFGGEDEADEWAAPLVTMLGNAEEELVTPF